MVSEYHDHVDSDLIDVFGVHVLNDLCVQ